MTDEPLIRNDPQPLPPGSTSVLWGSTFALSDGRGDITPGMGWAGVFHRDTRVLSGFTLEVDGIRPLLLSSGQTASNAARFFTAVRDDPAGGVSIQRRRVVGRDLVEDITLQSHRRDDATLTIRLGFAADFADLFEVKAGVVPATTARVDPAHRRGSVRFENLREELDLWSSVRFSQPADVRDGDAVFRIDLPARGTWHLRVVVSWGGWEANGDGPLIDAVADGPSDEGEEEAVRDRVRWVASFPVVRSDPDDLATMYERSIDDLAALRLHLSLGREPVTVPAAGLPWFMTLFGRDALITSFFALPFAPGLARGALRALAALQGDAIDGRRDEEPGKILHEIRSGPLTLSGQLPFDPYYGSVDATILWLIVLSEYERWTGDAALVRELWPNALRALGWIDANRRGSRDGFVRYLTASSVGLVNQGWKDSWDAIGFHDGSLAGPPVALCEVQGYVLDAWRRTADLAGRIVEDDELGRRLLHDADAFAERFEDAFWTDGRGGFYVLGLDGDGRPIDAVASNMGHLLWSGAVPRERVERVVDRLFSPSMWSGWGIRTLSTEEPRYDPVGYHVGSVWPHDNAIIAAGMVRAGKRDRAVRIAEEMIAAAGYQDGRLPEAFAGYERSESLFPVRYPTASSPQAWATATTFVWLRLLLGLNAVPTLGISAPSGPYRIDVDGLPFRGGRFDVRASERGPSLTPVSRDRGP